MIEYTVKKCESFAFAKNIKQAMNLYKSELSDKNYKKLFIADSTTEIPSIFEPVEVLNLIDRIKNDKLENVLLFVELGKKKKLIKRIIKENDETELINNFRYGDLSESTAKTFSNFVKDLLNDKITEKENLSPAVLAYIMELYKHVHDGRIKKQLLGILNLNHESTTTLATEYPIEYEDIEMNDHCNSDQFRDINIRLDDDDQNYSNSVYKADSDQLQKAMKGNITQLEAFSKSEFVVIHGKKSACIELGSDLNQNYDVLDSLARNGVNVSPNTGRELSLGKIMRAMSILKKFHIVFIHSAVLKNFRAFAPNESEPAYVIGKGEITAIAYRYLVIRFFPYMSIPDEEDKETSYLF